MTDYTPEQIAIAKRYEARAFAAIHDQVEFDRVMAEFDEVKKSWNTK